MDVVIGVDAGGSQSRATCVDAGGHVRGRGVAGGGSPEHNGDARANVRAAIERALAAAARRPADVAALTAGIAGFNGPADAGWADDFTAVPGIRGPRRSVNDTEVAHAGAFGLGPGVIAVAGTGSMIFGITEAGRRIRNDSFRHYAGGARHLSFDVVQRILARRPAADARTTDVPAAGDAELVRAALAHWGAADQHELYEAVLLEALGDDDDLKRHYGAFAPVVTAHARSSPLVAAALALLVEKTRIGIELVAAAFAAPLVPVVLEGGLARSAAFSAALDASLTRAASACRLAERMLAPADGAALMALRTIGSSADIAEAL